jgi:hypothetical protein
MLAATAMKRALALVAATVILLPLQPVAYAGEKWEGDFHQCHIRKWFSNDELAEIGWKRDNGQTIVIEQDEIGDLQKAIRLIKQCKAFYKCLEGPGARWDPRANRTHGTMGPMRLAARNSKARSLHAKLKPTTSGLTVFAKLGGRGLRQKVESEMGPVSALA